MGLQSKLTFFMYNIIEARMVDNKGPYVIAVEKAFVIVDDRNYNEFPMLNVWNSKGLFPMSRHKDSLALSTTSVNWSNPDKNPGSRK